MGHESGRLGRHLLDVICRPGWSRVSLEQFVFVLVGDDLVILSNKDLLFSFEG